MREQPVIWAALCAYRRLCLSLPHSAAVSLGRALGRTVCRLSGARAGRARSRCAKVLGVSGLEAAKIVSDAYGHFGMALTEFFRLPKEYRRIDEIVTVTGEENIVSALDRGRGVILLSAHIGCWEYGAAAVANLGFPMNAIGAEQRDWRMTDAIAKIRISCGVKTLGKGLDLRAAVGCLRKNEILAILLDQDARESGIVSPFLGFPASTPAGPIKLAKKLGCAVVPVCVTRNADGVGMSMRIYPALAGPDGSPFGDDPQYAADRCNDIISGWIRETPGQWMWMYPRWATTVGDL
ncbi:MAG: lysophospholipid acyltransferase family protein [Synergistaceae bacterium]|jgi:KDO2-lipid IV(A) lauroyltransferase|nr:lysophospholipid acyltransferase family protein [Synergistaceae bacterium]